MFVPLHIDIIRAKPDGVETPKHVGLAIAVCCWVQTVSYNV